MRTVLRFLLVMVLAAAGLVVVQRPASAAMEPSFKVTCYPTGIAQNDPIVFPGQSGLSHMHTFYGAKGVTQSTTAATLSAATSSQCGSYFDGIDKSAYWIPTLYKNGQQLYADNGSFQLAAYYQRAGGADGEPVDQAWPRGLKIIAGDMHATSPQHGILYFCANSSNSGDQSKASTEFPSCASNELLVAKLQFPDCWDGRYLDSADHKSHMAYSSGPRNTCPADHPVKLAQLTMEAWFHGVNGAGSEFRWASGGPYSFHGDVIAMWEPRAAANLVNQCINVAFDCNPLIYPNIPVGPVSQAQIDAQYTGVEPPQTSPTPMPSMTMTMSPTASASPTMTMSPTASASPTMTMSPTATPTTSPTASPTMTMSPTVSASPTATPKPTQSPTSTPTKSPTASPSPTPTLTSGVPTISGTTKVGRTLRVDAGDWGPDPVELRYQWYRGSEAIDGATGTRYGLTWDDLGSSISVSVTGTKSGYASVTKVSAAVGPVTGRGWWWWTTSDGLRAV